MADLKITGLDALAEGSVQAADALAIADVSQTETKKVTVKDLIAAGVALIDAGDIPAAKVGTLGTNQVGTGAIQNGAVTNVKLANSSISLGGISIALGATDATPAFDLTDATGYTTTNLVGTITNAQLAGSISGDKLATGAIPYAKLNITDGDIPGAKITGNSITNAQIGANAVGSSELADDAVDTAAIVDGAVTNAKLSSATITVGGVTLTLGGTDATPAFNLTDATNYPTTSLNGTITNAQLAGSITGDKLANVTVTYAKLNIIDGDIPGAKITGNSITTAQIAANAVTASELADNAVDTAAVVDAAITSTKIAANTITAGNLAANSVGASELANNSVDTAAVVDAAITTAKIADGAVTTAKLSGTISAGTITDGAVTTSKLADDAVTNAKLAANAVETAAVANAAITNDKVASGISGTKIGDGTITATKLNTSNIDRSLNVASGNLGINNTVTAATRSGISYNAQGLITGTVALAAADLPVATSSAVGGVSVGTGLSVNGAGAISITNAITAASISGITYNAQGQITATTALVANDLPVATTSAKGAVQITSGGGLTVDGSGNLTTSTSGVSAGTYQSVTVNTKGVITAGTALTETQIPSLPASKITSGSLDAARIANDSIDGTKLSNTSTAIFQSIAQSGYPTAQFNGQILFDTVSEDAFIWDGNAWQAITTLTKGSLVFGGTYNANTSQMVATTSAGIAAGLSVGSNLPTASATTDGVYVVVATSGTPSSPAPAIAFAPPDYILGVTNSAGSSWNEVDLSQTVAGQVASNITFTPYGQISATNLQDALQELETEKLAKAGGTVTGELLIGNTGSLVFEGSTVDAFETRLTVADPTTSDKVITLPNITGTVITTGDTNTVTKDMVDGSLINTNIAAGAAIAFSKLAALTSAQILVGNGSNVATAVAVTGDISINNAGLTAIASGVIVDGDISNSAAITGSKVTTGTTSAVGVLQLTDSTSSTSATTAATPNAVKSAYDLANAALPKTAGAGNEITGNVLIDNDKEIRLYEADGNGSAYVGIKGATDKGSESSYTISLPAAAPTANQILKANASSPTTLEWTTDVTNTAAGDLTGTTLASNVVASSLTSVGTLTSLTVSGTITGDVTGDLTGNADTATTATTATSFTVTANNSTDETVYPLFVDGATGSQGAETDTGLTYNPSTGLLTSTGFSGAGTSLTALNASNLSSGTVATARLGSGTASSSNFLRGDNSWQTIDLTNLSATNLTSGTVPDARFPSTLPAASGANLTTLNASNLSSGTVNVARLGSGSSVSTKFLRGDNTWQTISATPEGTAILSTGESGGTKFLREDGDGTCSWQAVDLSGYALKAGTSFTGDVTFTTGQTNRIIRFDYSDQALEFWNGTKATFGTDAKSEISWSTSGYLKLNNSEDGSELRIQDDLSFSQDGSTFHSVLTTDYLSNFADNRLVTASGSSTFNGESNLTFDGTDLTLAGGLSINHGSSGTPVPLTIHGSGAGGTKIVLSGSTGPLIQFKEDTTDKAYIRWEAGVSPGYFSFHNQETNRLLRINNNLEFSTNNGSAWQEVIHQGNVGSGGAIASSAIHAASLTLSGDLTVNGTTTTIDTTNLNVTDKNITLGNVSTPSDATADGGGLTLKGATDKTFNWVDSTDAWTSSEHIQVASGKTFIGNLTGDVTGDCSGSAATVTGAAQSAITSLGTLTALGIGTAAAAGTTQLDVAGSIGGIRAKVTTNYGSYKIFDGLNSSGTSVFSVTHNGTVTGTLFSGSGASLTNVNATTLDSIDSGSFLRSDANDSASGQIELTSGSEYPLRINNSNDGKFVLEGSSNPYFYFKEGTTSRAYVQWVAASNYLQIWNTETSRGLRLGSNLIWNDGSDRQVLHQNNVGSGGALSSTNVYVNQIHGDGSNLTNLPASGGGTITATASGTIAANTAVHINSNGTVQVAAVTPRALGSETNVQSSRAVKRAYWSSSKSVIIVLSTDGGSRSRARAGSLSGTTITWGNDVDLTEGSSSSDASYLDIAEDDDGTFVVVSRNSYSTGRLRYYMFTISGVDITITTSMTNIMSGNASHLSLHKTNNNEFVVVYNNANSGITARKGTRSGNSISWGGTTSAISFHGYNGETAFNSSAGKIIIPYSKNGFWYRLLTVSSMSVGSEYGIYVPSPSYIGNTGNIDCVQVGNTTVMLWRKNNENGILGVRAGVISSSSQVSWGTAVDVSGNECTYISGHYNSSTGEVMVTYNRSSNRRYRHITLSGTDNKTVTVGSEQTLSTNAPSNYHGGAADPSTGADIWAMDISGLSYRVLAPEGTSFTADNFIGFSSAAYTNGQTATINVVGSTTTQSGLTPASKYYVQKNGTLGTTAANPSIYAGIAISSTSLLIKG